MINFSIEIMRSISRVLPKLLLIIASLAASPAALASSKTPGKVIAGWVEKVTLVSTNETLKAKLDSGAETSSIYALNVKKFKRDGERWVRFDLVLEDEPALKTVTLERKRVRRVRIKDHNDAGDSRSVVELGICFNGRPYKTQFTLADRSNFIYPLLLGRRFLAGIAVIDPDKTFQTLSRCDTGSAELR